MSWLLALLGLPVLGVLVKIVYDTVWGRHTERRELRREGAAVVTPVTELLTGLGPEAILWGSNEEISEHLREWHTRWWQQRRPALLEYANHHPSERVRRLANELVIAFGSAFASTQYLFESRGTSETMEPYHDAKRCKGEAVAKADELMVEIRRTRPRWMRLRRGLSSAALLTI